MNRKSPEMSCDICARVHSSRLHLLCPTCARNHLYQSRLEIVAVLLERDHFGQQIEAAINSKPNPEYLQNQREQLDALSGTESSRLWTFENIRNEQLQSSARLKSVLNKIEGLRSQIKNKNLGISQRKLELARRRSDSESAKYQLAERESTALAAIRNNIKRTDHLWHSLHSKTAEARIFLCREVASLYGLRQRARKRDNGVKECFMIAGASTTHISASLSCVAHVLVLISHYLSLRLPAEITLPHRNYPTPTIHTPSASYQSRKSHSIPFPDQSSSSPTTPRPPASHHPTPRPRPLCIDKTLPKLAKEDPGTYALFMEGVTLLGWNVAWLCRSQGLNAESDSWEDVCDVGKNLWQLLVAPPGQPSTLIRALANRDNQAKITTFKDSPRTTIQRTKTFPMFGHYSHGTAHSFLGASEGTDFIRTWRLPAPTRVNDRLKSTLLGEMASAEWELLEEKEWDDVPQEFVQPLACEPANDSDTAHDTHPGIPDTESITPKLEAPGAFVSPPRAKGTSGWTKLRNR